MLSAKGGVLHCVCVCVYTFVLVGLFVWVYHNYCLCLWPLRASVMIALREQNASPTLRTWGTWEDVKGLTESKGLSLARHKHLPTVSAVSVTVYWKTRALVEILDQRGTPALLARPELFVTYPMFVFGFWSCWNDTVSLTIFLLYFFLSHVILQSVLWSRSQPKAEMWGRGVCGALTSLLVWRQKKGLHTEKKASCGRICGVFKWQLALPGKQKQMIAIICHEAQDETVLREKGTE